MDDHLYVIDFNTGDMAVMSIRPKFRSEVMLNERIFPVTELGQALTVPNL